jgi:hypothetical protein
MTTNLFVPYCAEAGMLLIPPTESDHLVVDGPVRKCIIAGVENQNSAAVPDRVFKSNLDFTRPRRAAADVVAGLNDHVAPSGWHIRRFFRSEIKVSA